MTQRLAAYFNDYAEYHRTRGNQVTHFVGIPLISCSLLGLLSQIAFGSSELFRPDLAWVLLLAVLLFYFILDWKIALPFSLVLVGLYFLGRSLSIEVLLAMQIVGWIVQYVGHLHFEKNKPAFYKNLTHTLVGPLWIFSKALGYGKPHH